MWPHPKLHVYTIENYVIALYIPDIEVCNGDWQFQVLWKRLPRRSEGK